MGPNIGMTKIESAVDHLEIAACTVLGAASIQLFFPSHKVP